MSTLRKNQKALQVLRDGEWRYVFCYNPQTGLVLTNNRSKAINASLDIEVFRSKFANDEFRAEQLS